TERGDKVAIAECTICPRTPGQGETQSHDQMLVLIEELIANLHLKEQSVLVKLLERARLFMLSSLEQIDTIRRTVEHDLALLAATLGADAAMNRGAETLFFSFLAKRTTHKADLLNDYPTLGSMASPRKPAIWVAPTQNKPVLMGFLKSKMKKTA